MCKLADSFAGSIAFSFILSVGVYVCSLALSTEKQLNPSRPASQPLVWHPLLHPGLPPQFAASGEIAGKGGNSRQAEADPRPNERAEPRRFVIAPKLFAGFPEWFGRPLGATLKRLLSATVPAFRGDALLFRVPAWRSRESRADRRPGSRARSARGRLPSDPSCV